MRKHRRYTTVSQGSNNAEFEIEMNLDIDQVKSTNQHTTLREEAYSRFMNALLERRFRPGRMLSQRELADTTGSSLASIREALKRLEGDGIVKLIPKRGVLICEATRKNIADGYDFRIMIETHAIRKYVEICDISQVETICKQTDEILNADPSQQDIEHFNKCLQIDRELHRQIVASLDNAMISECHQKIETTMMLARLNLPVKLNASEAAFNEHRILLDAIKNNDVAAATSLLREHLLKAKNRAMEFAEF